MKKILSLSISTYCSEKWDTFTPTRHGGFCSSCNKTVTDFTKMTDQEVLSFFQNKPANPCGRFRPNQLTTYFSHLPTQPSSHGMNWIKASLLSLVLTFISKESYSEEITQKRINYSVQLDSMQSKALIKPDSGIVVKGTVKGDEGETIPGASIILKGSTLGTSSNGDGYFEFPKELKIGEVLVVSFIGYETKEFTITKEILSAIEVTLTMDVSIMGAISVNEVYTQKPSFLRKIWKKLKQLW
jgi:hypothetical protein